MDLVIFTIGATERWLNSGVAQEALPQDGSHGKHRNTQVKAVVWQGMGVWGRLHTLVMLQRKRCGQRKRGFHTNRGRTERVPARTERGGRRRAQSPQPFKLEVLWFTSTCLLLLAHMRSVPSV